MKYTEEKSYINGVLKGLAIAHNYYLDNDFNSKRFTALQEEYYELLSKFSG